MEVSGSQDSAEPGLEAETVTISVADFKCRRDSPDGCAAGVKNPV